MNTIQLWLSRIVGNWKTSILAVVLFLTNFGTTVGIHVPPVVSDVVNTIFAVAGVALLLVGKFKDGTLLDYLKSKFLPDSQTVTPAP